MASPQTSFTQSPERRDFRKEVTDSIIKMLEDGVAPWQKPWDASIAGNLALPFNPTSNNSYRGGNAIHLIATAMRKDYEDPRWMTYKQAADNDWQVRKGEKGTQIEFWESQPLKEGDDRTALPDHDKDPDPEQGAKRTASRFTHRVYTVFNASQIEGVPAFEPKRHTVFKAVEAGEQILRNSGAKLKHDQPDRTFYSRSSDTIHLPPRDAFLDTAGYYGTALHELAHWTGHPDRLNRQTLNQSYRFGDQNYAREELRAELASVFLAAERGIPHNPSQHASYVGSWIQALRDDKNEIFRAAQDASRATEFLLALERDKTLGQSLVDNAEAPAPVLEQETARLKSDLESEPYATEPDPVPRVVTREAGDSIARLEPEDGVGKIHNNALGTDTAVVADPAVSSWGDWNADLAVPPNTFGDKAFQSAQVLATERLGAAVALSAALTDGGRYRGSVVGETEEFVIQQISSKSAIAHSKDLLDHAPQVGQRVSIAYLDSHGTVREAKERAKGHELAR
jgi:antirestriction protein ArdC